MQKRIVAGCMTGTSLDGLDIAIVEILGRGLEMSINVLKTGSRPLRELGQMLKPISRQHRITVAELVRISGMLGSTHAIELKRLIGHDLKIDFAAVHGQTLYHEPPNSMQLVNPWPITQELGIPVVYDFRAADLAAGGQGAPITPIADYVLFHSDTKTRVVVNLGGFVNYTWLPAGAGDKQKGLHALESIRGGDICACNQLLDEVADRIFGKPYDIDGQLAHKGRIDPEAFEMLLMMLNSQADSRRSLGTGDEVREWVTMFQHSVTGHDLARTACAGIAQVMVHAVGEADEIILAGGGTLNQTLVHEIKDRSDIEVVLSDNNGIDVTYREAICMCVLGALSQDGIPITLPQITGCNLPAPLAGCWTRR